MSRTFGAAREGLLSQGDAGASPARARRAPSLRLRFVRSLAARTARRAAGDRGARLQQRGLGQLREFLRVSTDWNCDRQSRWKRDRGCRGACVPHSKRQLFWLRIMRIGASTAVALIRRHHRHNAAFASISARSALPCRPCGLFHRTAAEDGRRRWRPQRALRRRRHASPAADGRRRFLRARGRSLSRCLLLLLQAGPSAFGAKQHLCTAFTQLAERFDGGRLGCCGSPISHPKACQTRHSLVPSVLRASQNDLNLRISWYKFYIL
jgi:hypothetical protein